MLRSNTGAHGSEAWPDILFKYYVNKEFRFCPEGSIEEDEHWGDHNTAWNLAGDGHGHIHPVDRYEINDWVYNTPLCVPESFGFQREGENYNSPDV